MPTRDDLLREIRRVLGDDVYEQAVGQMGEDKLIEMVLTQAAESQGTTYRPSSSASTSESSRWDWVPTVLWILFIIASLFFPWLWGVLWLIYGVWKAIEFFATSDAETIGLVIGGIVALGILGAIGYGIYRAAPFIWGSSVAWWHWLGSHVGAQ